ncbi:armadillo-type protein [Mycena capillaripes]|nr:armadillo-type protein [Mycena capillaripes]
MPSLTRQEAPASIHSWWSDTNPGLQGPTINLHAAAKPLMRLMYHRQVLALIRKNRGSTLSKTILETYLSYFGPWDYISRSTKDAIVKDLNYRAKSNADDARAMADSPVFYYLLQKLRSSDIGERIASCQLVGNFASHDFSISVILKLRVGEQLVSLLYDEDYMVVTETMHALSQIARWLAGVQAFVDAKTLDHVLQSLGSPSANIRKMACELVGRLASHEPATEAILKLQLNPLLRDEDSEVIEWALCTLSRIAASLDGAQAIVNAKMLEHFLELLDSPSPNVRGSICLLIGKLAGHESTAPAVLDLKPCLRLVTLLRL